MQNKESLYLADWFEKAKKDLERVRPRLLEGDLEDAAVHLQPTIEKYLKGYLLSNFPLPVGERIKVRGSNRRIPLNLTFSLKGRRTEK